MSLTLPDGKIFCNLPEQVAKNASDIKKIAAVLDGLNIQDNVVAIADISQILTRAELDIVEKPVAFLYYSDQLYIKRNEVSGSAFFDVIFSISGSTVISFTSKVIEVVLTTGALILTTSTYSTYSKTELDTQLVLKADITYVGTQLATKADLSGADFTGGITAPSIIEKMSGYSFAPPSSPTGFTITYDYAGVVKTGNKITFAVAGVINFSATPSDKSVGYFLIPSAVGSRLIPTSLFSSTLDIRNIAFANNVYTIKQGIANLGKNSNTSLEIFFRGLSSLSTGVDYYFRYEVTFLLSDNLAA